MMMMGMRASERVAQGTGRPAVAVNSLARADAMAFLWQLGEKREGEHSMFSLSLPDMTRFP